MEPSFSSNDKQMFYKYLNKSKVYFEYGAGGSTYQASIRTNITKIYSVESCKEWIALLQEKIKTNNVIFFYNEMNTQPNTWGHPGLNSTQQQLINYSDHLANLSDIEQKNINLLLIDGRFRVACCLKCFKYINSDCFVCFDDFFNRPEYHIILQYFDIVEKTSDNVMAVLQKKKNIPFIPEDIIKKYELVPN